ncbi:hypothetical protein B0H67DRAFT_278024 [Lasiosphaeris hirsuta]|uniref:Zn(2)-C6 fungal-type domain-containing protein n=1 Tax=Lasiosphaeris hirsuta TaxID=260670 RepID=A0AA40DRX5_9PEZI|nr:hypothetical protein B0H67DRAFT_278024 [Lasiosphaeris hirsuta]
MNTETLSKAQKGPRACATCARAKSRCIPGPDGVKCERCHRLNKPCSSQTPAPPRKRKEPKPTRVAELERRLEDLTARIESVQRQPPSPPDSEDAPMTGTTVPAETEGQRVVRQSRQLWPNPFMHIFPDTSEPHSPDETSPPAAPALRGSIGSGSSAATPDSPTVIQHPAGTSPNTELTTKYPQPQPKQKQPVQWPEGEEAEQLLAEYQTHMAHLYPFAVVPPCMNAAELRRERPFLWKAVMMEACQLDGVRQMILGNELLREISEAAIVRPQKSLDLLQGLQVLISWYHYSLNSFQMTNLLFLARSMCNGLGFSELQGPPQLGDLSSECLERMRAFAGTYYIVTVTFTTNKKPDGLMGTTYLEECCWALEKAMEYPTDRILVWLIRAQQLSQRICLALAFRNAGLNLEPIETPLIDVISRLEQQISTLKSSLPPGIRESPSLIGHLYVAEMLLYEIALGDNTTAMDQSTRLALLNSCLRATRNFLDNRFAQGIQEYPRFICMSSFDFVYSFLTALKLITLQTPGWDLARVRQDLDFDRFVERQVRDMEFMAERRRRRRKFIYGNWEDFRTMDHGGLDEGEEDPFLKLARKIRSLSRIMHEELQNEFATPQLTMVAGSPVMTVTDVTQGFIHGLDANSIWDDVAGLTAEWDHLDSLLFNSNGSFI